MVKEIRNSRHKKLYEHYLKILRQEPSFSMQMKQGQEASGLKHVTTFVFCPTKEMPFWKLCTIGASDYMMPKRNIGCGRLANRRNEYMMFISPQVEISQSSVGVYENESRLPDSKVLTSICNAFAISPAWLLMGEGEMHQGQKQVSISADSRPFLQKENFQPIENNHNNIHQNSRQSVSKENTLEATLYMKKIIELQDRLLSVTEQNADLRIQLGERDSRIRELTKENKALKEALKGTSGVPDNSEWAAG